MSENIQSESSQKATQMEANTYDILRKRLEDSRDDLKQKLTQLNDRRKEVFGSVDFKLAGNERVTTENNCTPWDMVTVDNYFLFGYNVHIGLKLEIELADVFSCYEYKGQQFHPISLEGIDDENFIQDFKKLYTYYKNTKFVKFVMVGPFLHMVFRVGKDVDDIKTFKWQAVGGELKYVDNRSEHEVRYPNQYDFGWKRVNRDHIRDGKYPHISIEDKVFVETIGGDLTIKVEDNTTSGRGVYHEPVENPDQTLDDAEFYYAIVENLVILKIKPYQENYRYFVFNAKLQEVKRIDSIAEACILLPDGHGVIFSNGYYLQGGELKLFENNMDHMVFERRLASPNGEDFLYVFYNKPQGMYLLLNYNLIAQKVDNPLLCHGFAFFENGEMCLFRGDEEPKKHHVIQIWQTPYMSPDFSQNGSNQSFLSKVGNKDVVRGMAECQELIKLIDREEVYNGLYVDLITGATDIIDSFHWVGHKESFNLVVPIKEIQEVASQTVEEFEKVKRIRQNTLQEVNAVSQKKVEVVKRVKNLSAKSIHEYVALLKDIRTLRGEIVGAKALRYVDLELLEGFENEVEEYGDNTSKKCVGFLLKANALDPYSEQISGLQKKIEVAKKVAELIDLEKEADSTSNGLDLLIEIVNNLKIHDPTQTAQIIDNITDQYTHFNQVKALLKQRKKAMSIVEGKAEFNAQLKLVEQSVANLLDISNTPQDCDDNANKLIIQLEELEGKFSDFEDFLVVVIEKRDEIYNAFESKKLSLVEARTKKATQLQAAAERVLKTVKSKVSKLSSEQEIQSYFAADLMVEKVKDIIKSLIDLGETVKADGIQSQLNASKDELVRQLKDKKELFVAGEGVIQLGSHSFYVNNANPELTIVAQNGKLKYHITSTNFYETVDEGKVMPYKAYWDQSFVSENDMMYRAEFLAYLLLASAEGRLGKGALKEVEPIGMGHLVQLSEEERVDYVRKVMAVRYDEGYVKGVHGQDAALMLFELMELTQSAGLLRYSSRARAAAMYYWKQYIASPLKENLAQRLKGAGVILSVFPDSREFEGLIMELQGNIKSFIESTNLFEIELADDAGEYLFYELALNEHFTVDKEAADFHKAFEKYLKSKNAQKKFRDSIKGLSSDPQSAYQLIRSWLASFLVTERAEGWSDYLAEVAVLLLNNDLHQGHVVNVTLRKTIHGLKGTHPLLDNGKYQLDYNHFISKMKRYFNHGRHEFTSFQEVKKDVVSVFRQKLKLNQFKPKVLSAFVRNKLIDKVYLPMIGANLAKQLGSAGEGKRTDQMGLLLLISPPGYGKTTLMEYIANRLGLIFVKVNGPALGHHVTSLDPAEAPNATAREELEKLGLAFEMGDNVMVYVDDIQHCNPEFLQKFISLCDAQRKIEGVYNGKTKTYDFRGKKLCVVMAGNPYTESGDKFQIPDMLSNRADIYNLGDIIGDSAGEFEMSYIENALTSNKTLSLLNNRSRGDVHEFIKAATDQGYQPNLEGRYSPDEMRDIIETLKKLLNVRDVILKVNALYIYSASQDDRYREEPAFKLQGSYRDMNKIAEKINPIMNTEEVMVTVMSHYENESQTLTSGAEANFLKFKSMVGQLTASQAERWAKIVDAFKKEQESKGLGQHKHIAALAEGIDAIATTMEDIKNKMN